MHLEFHDGNARLMMNYIFSRRRNHSTGLTTMKLTNSLLLITAIAACWASRGPTKAHASDTAPAGRQQQVTLSGVRTPHLYFDGGHF